jgi:hypothetical protein
MFGMSILALQLNDMPDKLKDKLPPTDSRRREDMRAWENGDADLAQKLLDKQVQNQRKRRATLKQQFKEEGKELDTKDERKWFTPKYFIKEKTINQVTGKAEYSYTPNTKVYWDNRDKCSWPDAPPLFEDDCEPFYE